MKPASSKAIFHAKTAFFIIGLNSRGVEFSIQNTIGLTGSDLF